MVTRNIINDSDATLRADKHNYYNDSEISTPGGSSGFNRTLVRILNQNKPVSKRFFELINRLNKFFSISRAVLIINDTKGDSLKMMAIWEQAFFREGVMLTIPRENSFLHRALGIRVIVNRPASQEFPHEFQGNFIENNILFNKSTNSLAICPLFADESLMGITCLTSPDPFTFGSIEEGHFDDIFRQLGMILADENMLML